MEFHNNQMKSEVEDPQARDEEQKINKNLQVYNHQFYKDTMTLIKLKMTKADTLIREFNDEKKLLTEELIVVKSEKQDILSKYNLTLEKNTRLELANGEFKRTIEKNEKLLETQCLKLEENEKHINQLIFKIKALEEETIKNLQHERKSLKTVKMVEKKVKTKQQACQTPTVEKRDISINTISKNELKKPLMVDKSFITEECKSMKNDPFPIYCAKCEVHIKPAPVEQVLRIMTMHPPLLPEYVSPPTSPMKIKPNTDFCDPIETEIPIGRQKCKEAEDLPLFNEEASTSSISKNHSSFLEMDKLARKVEKLENLMKKMKKNNTKQTNCQTDFSPQNIKFVVQMPSSEKLIKSYRQQKCKKNKIKRLNQKRVGYKKKEKLEENKWKIESFTGPQLRNLDSKKIKLEKQKLLNQKLEKELFEFPEEISSQERSIIGNTAVSNRSSLSPCTSEERLADFISTTRSSTITPVKNTTTNVDRSQKSVVQNINIDKSTVPPDLLFSNPSTSQMLERKSICHNLIKDKVQENNSVNHIKYEENILNNNNSNNLSENLMNNIGKELQTISGSNENENNSEIKIINEINREKISPNLEDNEIDSRNYSIMNKSSYINVSENLSESSNSNIHKNTLEKVNQKEKNVENYHPFEKNNSINQLPLSVNLEEKEEIQIKNDISKSSKTAFNLISKVETSSLDNIISEEITEQISVQETRFEPNEIKKNNDEKILPLVAESTANDKIIQKDKENNLSSLTLKDIDSRKKENTSFNRQFDKPKEILVSSDESSDSQFFTSAGIKQSKSNSPATIFLSDESSEEKSTKIKNDISDSSKNSFNLILEVQSNSLDNIISKEIVERISVQEARFEPDEIKKNNDEKILPLVAESTANDKIIQKNQESLFSSLTLKDNDSRAEENTRINRQFDKPKEIMVLSDESSDFQFFTSSGSKRSKLNLSATLILSDDSYEEKSTKIKNDISESSKTTFDLISEVESSSLDNMISKEIAEQISVQEARFEPDETEKNNDNEKILPLITESANYDKIIQKDKESLLSALTLKDNDLRAEENTPINTQFDKHKELLVSSDESSEAQFFSSSGLKRSKLNSSATLILSGDSSEEKSTKIKNDISESSKTAFNLISEVESSSLDNIISKEIAGQISVQESRFEPDGTEKNNDNEKILPLITESTDYDKIIQKDKESLLSSLTLKDNDSKAEENTPINRQFDKPKKIMVSSDESSESTFFSSSGLKRSKLNSSTNLILSDDSSEEKSTETLSKCKKLNENSKKRQKTSGNRKKLLSKIRNIKKISNKPIIYAQSEPKVSQTKDESITDLSLIHSTNESSSLNESFINLDLPIEESPPGSISVKKHRIAHTLKSISMVKDVEPITQAAKKIKLIPQRIQATDPVSSITKEMEMQCKQKKEISHTLEELPKVSQTKDESITDLPLIHSTNESSSLNESFIDLNLPIEESPPVSISVKKHRIAHTPKSISMVKDVEPVDHAAKKIKLIPQRMQATDPVSSITKEMEMQCKQKKEISYTLEELPKVSQTRDESITDLPLIHSTSESSSLNESFINLDLPIEEPPPVSIPVKKHRIAHTPKSISMVKDVEPVDHAAKKIKLIPQRMQATDPVSSIMKEMEMQCKQKKEISHTLEELPKVSQTRDESITDLPLIHSTNESSSLNESFINLDLPIEESPPVSIPVKKHRIAHTPKSISIVKDVKPVNQAAKKIKWIPQRVLATDPVSSITNQMEMQCKQKKEISHTLEELKPTLKELTKAINNEDTIASNLKLENTVQDENIFKGFKKEIKSEESEKCSPNILLPEISISTNHKENNIPSSESNTISLIQQTSETVPQTNVVQRGRKRTINVKINENLEKNPFKELRSRQVIITETPQEKKLKTKTFSIVIDETNSCLSKSIVVSHLNEYTANPSVVSCISKAKKNCMIKVANKNKEAIEAKLNTLIEAQWTNESHIQTLNSLLDFHDLRTIAAYLIGFASEKLSGTETFDRSHTPPAPIMTETEQKLVTLIVGIEQLNPGFSGLIMDGIQYKLFKLGSPQEVQIVERLFRILVVLSKIKKDRAKVRIFCCDALYCLNIRAINIIYVALTCWPEVLPKHDSNNDIIVKTIVHIIMTLEVSKPYPKLNSLRKLLSTYYEYPNSGYMTNVFKVELLKNLQENVPGINTAVLLLCKKMGPVWSLPNIILNLKQMIVNQLHPSLYEALNLLGNILRSYPVSDPNNSVGEIIDQLCDVLARNEGADDLQEGVVSCLLSISKFKYKQIALSVIKWQFNKNLRPVTKDKLMSFFKQHDAKWWWKFVKTHFPLPK